MIMGFYRKRVKETSLRLVLLPLHFDDDDDIDMPALLQQTEDSDLDSDSDSNDEGPLVVRRSGGCPKGSINLINSIKKKNNIPDDVKIVESTIRQRVKRKRIFTNGSRGHESPLLPIESTVVRLIIQLSRICQCLTPSQGLSLVKLLIKDTPVQGDLISFKATFYSNADGEVGSSYWRTFMKRNGHLIVSKKGQKHELDRASWSTYHNFYRYTVP